MTPDEMRAGLLKAFELLTYGSPDRELHDKAGITKWIEDCDAWLDKFAPSKVGADEPTGECPHCREVYEIWANTEGFAPVTAPEAYQKRVIEQMREAAERGLRTACHCGAEQGALKHKDGCTAEPSRDAEDAVRWRFAKEQMNYSFDGENRTHYMKAEGREDFEETVDRRRGLSENRGG